MIYRVEARGHHGQETDDAPGESEGTAPEEKLQEIELHEDNSCCARV